MAAQLTSRADDRAGHVGPGPGDAELLAQAIKGDRMAAGMFIHRHQAAVRAFLRWLGGREEQADDLAQETFLRALRGEDRYDRKRPMRAWLLAIARRIWVEQEAKAKRAAKLPAATSEVQPERLPPVDATANPRMTDAERQAHRRRLVRQAMSGLTDAQRQAVLLVHQQGLAMAEAAAVMRMRPGAVKVQLSLGRAVLRRLLEPHMEPASP